MLLSRLCTQFSCGGGGRFLQSDEAVPLALEFLDLMFKLPWMDISAQGTGSRVDRSGR